MMEVLGCFQVNGPDDARDFCSCTVTQVDAAGGLWALRERLARHYKTSKYRTYFNAPPHNVHRCITILRQVLRPFGYVVHSRDKHCDHSESCRCRFFNVRAVDEADRSFRCRLQEKIVSFD